MLIFTEECYMQHLATAFVVGIAFTKMFLSGSLSQQKDDPMLKKLTGGKSEAISPYQPSQSMQPVGGQLVNQQPERKPTFMQMLFGERMINDNRAQVYEEQEHFDPNTGNITGRNTRMSFDKR